MFRLYVDEVGTDDLTNIDEDHDRYLSLTGVAMKIVDARDQLEPNLNWIKTHIFDHDPDDPLVLHRRKIMQFKGAFGILRDEDKKHQFDQALMRIFEVTNYTIITGFIDKKAMLRQIRWRNKHPYHYLMEILVEKYTQFLERKNSTGDIMPEGRKKPKDPALQEAYETVRQSGTYYISSERMRARLPSGNLKFRYKTDNIAGLQLCDLLAHPSHMVIREWQKHEVRLGGFCQGVKRMLLDSKYDRSNSGKILGYGIKWLP